MIPNFFPTMVNDTKCVAEWIGAKTGLLRGENHDSNIVKNGVPILPAINIIAGSVVLYGVYWTVTTVVQLITLPFKVAFVGLITLIAREYLVLSQNSNEEESKARITDIKNCTKKEAERLTKNTLLNAFWFECYCNHAKG